MAMLPLYAPLMAALEESYELLKPWEARDPAAFLRAHGARVRAVVTTTSRGFAAPEFDAFPALEALACYGPYVTLLDLRRAGQRGVSVSCTPDSTAESVADLAMGMVVGIMRRLSEADRFVRSGQWPTQAFASGREVHGKRCGIVGFGRIGQELARRAAAFDMQVSYHGPRAKAGVAHRYVDDLQALARESDCLVIACALTPETRGMVNAAVLDALGPDGFLVNVARGAIVDEAALIDALAQRRIAGAALDVFADEPQVPAALRAMEQVLLAPHIGTSTRENRDERMRKLLANLRAHFTGERAPHPVPTDA
ncbi:2-hydroxyacid dehydrogenase [Variovorax sp. PBL-E5]|uniref:2-hydroxyacid dehydrogenase n=1 Tax=Variovorax sp. PBL-E5 TaxID=434014 RepID=UPI0013187E7E|nr:2-hydroxyacid dehydrogenase [Variovorax sp. PBL-E5]VTU23934.1 Putative 2-hydroxyacid dehydrogenase [Variovorax sp. PBL-E5]